MSFVIQLRGEAKPTFYSTRAARDFGSPHGWTDDANLALQFARREDGEGFRDTFLPHQAPMCTVQPLTERIAS